MEVLPGVSTVNDFVSGYEASSVYGLGAPKNTPTEIIGVLNAATNAILADPQMRARLADMGGTALAGSPADFANIIAAETDKWGKVVRASGVKPE
jgi:tripartite-type tricarboxylate transporter receptor subunit TctC